MQDKLTPRERFARIMHHQEADRVPLDFAGTSLTSADPQVIQSLLVALGFAEQPHQQDEACDERILRALQVDFRRIGSLIASGDEPIPSKPGYQIDMWHITRKWTGQYWDIVDSPLRGATVDDLDHFPWADPYKVLDNAPLELYRKQARHLWEQTDYVVVAEHPVYGVLELACWMCGFDDFLARLASDTAFVHALFSRLLEFQKVILRGYYGAVGEYIHLTTSGDDFGTQSGPFMSPRMFRTLVLPYLRERIAYTRQFTNGYFWHHTCGSVFNLLPDLIEAGIDILNPIQPGAWQMEPERLKAEYGSQLCFHGGFDTQGVLPFGSPQTIADEVRRVMEAMKPNGGYIFSAAHNIQSDVSAANVLAMYRSAVELGRYT